MVAVPEFLVATIAVLIFAVKLQWLPALSFAPENPSVGEFLRAYAMPVMTLSFVIIAQMARMTRAAVIDQLESAVCRNGGPERRDARRASYWRMRCPTPSVRSPMRWRSRLSYLLGGAIIVETIFNYPGLASLMVDAVTSRDMPLLQTCAMIFCCAYLGLVLLADVCAIVSNPKLRTK